VLPESPSDIQGALRKQNVHSIMSIENACQAVGTGDSGDEEESSLPDTLPIAVKSLVDDLLFPKKNPRLCQLRTLSTDRLQTLFKAGHQRHLSGDTSVGSNDGQTKTSFVLPECSVPNSSILDSTDVQSEDKEVQSEDKEGQLEENEGQSENTEVQLEGNEVQLYRQLAFYNASPYDSEEERIRAEVGAEWKAAFKSQGRKHNQDILDVQEGHMDDLKRVDTRFGAVQREGQRFKHQRDDLLVQLKVVKEERDELQESFDLDTYSDENATLREENARLRGWVEYGRQIGLEKVMGLEYKIQDQEITISVVFQENTGLRDELAEVAEEKRFLWSERATDRDALREVLEQMGPLEEELAEAREEIRATDECWARDSETLDEISEQKYQLGIQLAATVVENNALKLAVVGQQQGMQNGWAEGLIHLALQLLARMQSLDTELQRQGSNMYNEERAALMSYCCETLRPHGVNVSALTADDKALMEGAVLVTASPTS